MCIRDRILRSDVAMCRAAVSAWEKSGSWIHGRWRLGNVLWQSLCRSSPRPSLEKPSRLTLRPQDTIDNTKVKIHDKLGIPADHQCLTGVGKQLVNERTVSEYAIRKKGGQKRIDLTFGFGSMRRDAELF